jgi:succinate dehydrogenase/fumarate reductase cytochrome b subunit
MYSYGGKQDGYASLVATSVLHRLCGVVAASLLLAILSKILAHCILRAALNCCQNYFQQYLNAVFDISAAVTWVSSDRC